jgi:hypothetical protein
VLVFTDAPPALAGVPAPELVAVAVLLLLELPQPVSASKSSALTTTHAS